MCAVQRLAQKSPEIFRLAKLYQSPERSIGVCRSSVDEKSGLVPAVPDIRIYSLANTRGIVAAFQRQFPD